MAEIAWGQSFLRTSNAPLVGKEDFTSVAAMNTYIKTDATAYVGQVVKVVSTTSGESGVYFVTAIGTNGSAIKLLTTNEQVSLSGYFNFISSVASLPTTNIVPGNIYVASKMIIVSAANSVVGEEVVAKAKDFLVYVGKTNNVDKWLVIQGDITVELDDYATKESVTTELNKKVDKVNGKGLSTNDYTTNEKNKLAGIAANAEVNVQSDWNETNTSSDAFIKNKPKIPNEVTESTVAGWGFTKNTGTYIKPSTGIPKSDLASAVQNSLGKADTALQTHQDISHLATKTDVANEIAKQDEVILFDPNSDINHEDSSLQVWQASSSQSKTIQNTTTYVVLTMKTSCPISIEKGANLLIYNFDGFHCNAHTTALTSVTGIVEVYAENAIWFDSNRNSFNDSFYMFMKGTKVVVIPQHGWTDATVEQFYNTIKTELGIYPEPRNEYVLYSSDEDVEYKSFGADVDGNAIWSKKEFVLS